MSKRNLNAAYAIEVINGRLNCSSDQVENQRSSFNNISYVKKIAGRGLVSAVCQKYNIQRYAVTKGLLKNEKIKIDKKVVYNPSPAQYGVEDIFGFMQASKEELTEEMFNQLPPEQQSTFKKERNKYTRNVTKKRKSRFLMSPLVNVSNRRINLEWNVATTGTENMPYTVETYSGIFAGISNINIADISQFNISDNETEFRDYAPGEVDNINIDISKEEKYNRIESVLRGLQYLSIEGNQNNYLTDTSPKLIILGEYSWGNNVFQGIIKGSGLDIEALKETIEENEDFRLSNIYIGISNRILDENYQGLKEKLVEELKDYEFIKISTVKKAFDTYLEYLYKTL